MISEILRKDSLNAEQTSKATTGQNDHISGRTTREAKHGPTGFSPAVRLHTVAMTICVVSMLLQGCMAATTDVYALEKLRVAELKQILKSRGLSCDGCTEKRAYVDMVMESSHLDRRYGSYRAQPRNPNDWSLPHDNFRIDLWATLVPALSYACTPLLNFMVAHPLLAVIVLLGLGFWGLKLAHRSSKHTDIPFKQYMRFQARLQYKHALRASRWVWVQLLSIQLVCSWLWLWTCQRSWTQVSYTAAVLCLWGLFSWAGFGAVFVLLMGFATVFMNLGERRAGQASAYTVFNNFQPLEGELRMEQVEAEMRHMPAPRNVHLNPHPDPDHNHNHDHDDVPVAKAGRNDKVEVVGPDGAVRAIKVKNLQGYLDRGYTQLHPVRYEGILYPAPVSAQ